MTTGLQRHRVGQDALPSIRVTERDWRRLTSLLSIPNRPWPEASRAALEMELARATRVPNDTLAPDVVTMNSRVLFEVHGEGRFERTLVYPWDANDVAGRLSVLDPIGTALLGLKASDSIAWPFPDGSTATVRVLSVLYQPEAAGDSSL